MLVLGNRLTLEESVLVETSLREGWLLTVDAPCIDLPFAQAIGLSSGPGNTVSTFDYVMVGQDRCRIREDVSIHSTRFHRRTAPLPNIHRAPCPHTPVAKQTTAKA